MTAESPEVRYGVIERHKGKLCVRDSDTDERFRTNACGYLLDGKDVPRVTFTVASALRNGERWADRVYPRP